MRPPAQGEAIMDLKELGSRLRLQRENLGMSIEDVSENTRISRSILNIFEAGDRENYPHPVYAKGFIRNYARALGLDPEECVRVLERNFVPAQETPEEQQEQRKPLAQEIEERSAATAPGRSIWSALGGALVLAIILGALIWYFSFYQGSGEQPAAPVQQQESEAEPVAAPEPQAAAQAVEEDDGETAQDVQPQDDGAQGLSASASAEQEPAAASDRPGAQPEAMPQGDLNTLVIKVAGDKPCWVGVWLPDVEEIARDFTVRGGGTETYRFSGTRHLRFGRAEAVTLIFNGREMELDGRGVVNLTLP